MNAMSAVRGLLNRAGVTRLLGRRLVVIEVTGDSMRPGLLPGERLLVHRTGRRRPRRGDIVVLEWPDERGAWVHPPLGRAGLDGRGWLVKRVVAVGGDEVPLGAVREADECRVPPDALVVAGDNRRRSFDSRHIGFIPRERVLGVMVRRMSGLN
jgi:signal peptidase I